MKSKSSIKDRDIFNTKHQIKLKELFYFELVRFYGRKFHSKKPILKKNKANLLHLGCGSNKFEGWINADFFRNLFKFWKSFKNRPDWMLDLRYPLNCDDNVWDGVFTEHTLQHLYPNQVLNLLKELNRTMKPNAWLRITVPDLKKYVNFYCQEKPETIDDKFYNWSTGCEAIHSLTQNHWHFSVWDSELLRCFLEESGFTNIKEVSFMEGTNKLLLKDKNNRKWEDLYMEAQKM